MTPSSLTTPTRATTSAGVRNVPVRSTSCTSSTIAALTGAGTPGGRAASTTAPLRKSISVSCPRRMLCSVEPGFGTCPSAAPAAGERLARPQRQHPDQVEHAARDALHRPEPHPDRGGRPAPSRACSRSSRRRSPSSATTSCTLSPVIAGSALTWLMSSFVHCAPSMSSVTSTGSALAAPRDAIEHRGVPAGAPTISGFGPVTVTSPGREVRGREQGEPAEHGAREAPRGRFAARRGRSARRAAGRRRARQPGLEGGRGILGLRREDDELGTPVSGLGGSHRARCARPSRRRAGCRRAGSPPGGLRAP